MMTEERQVHEPTVCRNASNPFQQFKMNSKAMEGLNTSGKTTALMPGITKNKDDGFGPSPSPSPTTPLGEGVQSGNLVVDPQSILLASNGKDEANDTKIKDDGFGHRATTPLGKGGDQSGNLVVPCYSKRQRKRLRAQQEAMKAHQTATVQEKKIIEPPPYVSGEKFVYDLLAAFPPLTYHGYRGGEQIYAPPIPVKADNNAQINYFKDISKVGLYPDHVVFSIAMERDNLKAQLMEVTTKHKMMYQNLRRQAELWRAKYYAIANAPPVHGPASHGQDSGSGVNKVRC